MNLDSLSPDLAALPYPPQIQWVDRDITGDGFYPGARNCLFGSDPAPHVMLMGRDFGTLSYYSSVSSIKGRGEHALTWRHTKQIYVQNLFRAQIFCTNYLMGVRVDGSAKGDLSQRLSPSDWQAFEGACWQFLQKQITEFKPALLVVFGADNERDLRRKDRLGDPNKSIIYAPHPHHAIGSVNTSRHHLIRDDIQRRLAL